jgi:hypothetical protein
VINEYVKNEKDLLRHRQNLEKENTDNVNPFGEYNIPLDQNKSATYNTKPMNSGHQFSEGGEYAKEANVDLLGIEAAQIIQSLRDHLAAKETEREQWCRLYNEERIKLRTKEEEIKKLKEALKELILIAEYYHDSGVTYSEMPYKNWTASINNAKSLL